jgi:hypothetical protein
VTSSLRFGGGGLAHVSTEDLKRVLARVHDGTLKCPITHPTLIHAGLPKLIDDLGHLNGLDERATKAVIVAVLAEREAVERRNTPS